jgi:hypothetical protein
MRKLAPLLDLEGNVRKAKRWIPWAQQQMKRLKGLNVDELVNQTLRPINGCIVTLKSVLGNDYIRINVLQEEPDECEYDWDYVVAGDTVTFDHNSNECPGFGFDRFFWDFGDGQFSELGDTTHEYGDFYETDPAGNYEVTLYSFTRDIPNLQPAIDFPTVFERKGGWGFLSDVGHADGWANYAVGGSPWQIQGGSLQSSKHRAWVRTICCPPEDQWMHESHRATHTIPLSDLASNPAVIAGKAFIFLRGGWHIWYESSDFENENVIWHPISGTDIRDHGHGGMKHFWKSSGNQEFLAGILDQDVPLVDGVFSCVGDPNGSAGSPYGTENYYNMIALDPEPLGRNQVGWFTWSSKDAQLEIIPYTKKKVITKTITIT